MKKRLLFTLLFTVSLMFAFTQSVTIEDNDRVGWSQGDVLAGANTTLGGTSIFNAEFSPEVGFALTDIDLVTLSVAYTNVDDVTAQRYQLGYQRSILCDGLYVGVGYGISKANDETQSVFSSNIGYFKTVWDHLYISPRIGLSTSDGDVGINTQLTFGFVL